MLRRRVVAALAVASLASLTLAACDGGGTAPAPRVVSVIVVPSTESVEIGQTKSLTAQVLVENGASTKVTWTTSDPSRVAIVPNASGGVDVTGVSAGTATLTAHSTADQTREGSAQVTVTERAGIRVAVSPATLTVAQGTSGTSDVTLTRVGPFAAPVDIKVEGVPTGVTATAAPPTLSSFATAGTVTVVVGSAATPGTYTLTVRAQAQGVSDATDSLKITVPVPPGFSLAFAPESLTVAPGQSGSTKGRVVSLSGYTGQVTLSIDPPPTGVSVSLSSSQLATGDSTTLTARVGAGVKPGRYVLTVRGKSPGVAEHFAAVPLLVIQPGATVTSRP